MKKILLFGLLVSLLNSGSAQDGQLDRSFGNGGLVITNIGVNDPGNNKDTKGKQILVNPNGSMYLISSQIALDIVNVSKKDKDGKSDLSYGKNGFATTLSLLDNSPAVLQQDGKIVIAGVARLTESYDKSYSVYRLNTNGNLDSTFNGKGFKRSTISSYSFDVDLAIQNDGKIVVGGSARVNNTNHYLLYRLNADGSDDKSFTQIGNFADSVVTYKSIAIQNDGKIVASGYKKDYLGNNVFTISRHNTDGSIDADFKTTGIPDSYTSINGLPPGAFFNNRNIKTLVDGEGNILVAGTVKDNFGIARFKKDGSFDTLVTTDFAKSFYINYLYSASVGKDGTIILLGTVDNNGVIASFNKDLDVNTNFSDDGKLIATSEGFLTVPSSVTIQKDGKILLSGFVYKGDYPGIAAVRFNSNGSVDETFADKGKLLENILQGNTSFNTVAVQNDGKIVAGGYAFNGIAIDFALARYTSNGSLDNSFSGDGKVMTSSGSTPSENYIETMAIQTDGKIIAGGSGDIGPALVRYNTNGTVEHEYGSGGIFNSIAIQKDGKFIISTARGMDRFRNFSFDITFNGKGFLTFQTLNNVPFVSKAIALQKDEKIIVLGPTNLLRYNSNGILDSTFGTYGIVSNYLEGSGEIANSICIQTDDKILIGGTFQDISNPTIRYFSITRLNKNGSRDTTFNGGKNVHLFTENTDVGIAIKVQGDGKIIIAGNSNEEGQTVFKIARFNSDGSLDKTFNNTGSVTTYLSGAYANLTDIVIRGNNLYAVGDGLFPGRSGVVAKYRLCNEPEVLPLKINFEGQLQNNKTSLQWQVQNQQQLKYFTVEKSRDSIHFDPIENIAANNNNLAATYAAVDNSPFAGTNFYRLKLKKLDSTFTYSNLVNINLANTNLSLKVTPNPAKNRLVVTASGENEKASIKIFDLYGRKYKEVKVSVNGNTSIPIDIDELPNGIFSLQLIKKSTTEIILFVKQ